MVKKQRLELLSQYVKQRHFVTLEECTSMLKTSESTVRRDFEELESKGILKRFHGGAEYVRKNAEETSIQNRIVQNKENKDVIAHYAASLVEDGDTIFLDAGSTVINMIPYLQDKDVRVVTNGVTHIELLTKLGISTTLLGGVIKTITSAIVGEEAEVQLSNYFFDKAFLGINSISKENGYSTPDQREAIIKKIVIRRSGKTYFLASTEKFNTNSFSKVADLDAVTLITDKPDESYLDSMDIVIAK